MIAKKGITIMVKSLVPETKLAKVDLRLIRKVTQQIIDAFRPQKIVLFGSYASGHPEEDSDVDLLVVMESKKRPVERAIEVTKSLRFYPFPMDILVRTPWEIRQRIQMGDPFYQEIMKRGKILYPS